jgi:hypothetical protein
MAEPTLTVQLESKSVTAVARLRNAFLPAGVTQGLFQLFNKLGSRAAGYVVKQFLSGDPLHRRTGLLAASVVGDAIMVGNVPAMRVGVFRGPALRYALIQERGGTVLPVNAKALAMPVNAALTPAGVARWPGPREYPGKLQFIPWRKGGGNAIGGLYDVAQLAAYRKNFSALRPLYVLLRQAKIPAHWYLRNGMQQFIPTVASELLAFLKARLTGTGVAR